MCVGFLLAADVHKTSAGGPGALISTHIYPVPLDVVVRRAPRKPSEAILAALEGRFYARSCIRTSENSPSR
jgi:hypothetical protein